MAPSLPTIEDEGKREAERVVDTSLTSDAIALPSPAVEEVREGESIS